MDYVYLDIAPELAVLGTGPFEYVRDLPDGCPAAFYVNDFGLSREACWAIPADAQTTTTPLTVPDVVVPGFSVDPVWQQPSRSDFAKVFGDIAMRLADGRMHKAVQPSGNSRTYSNGPVPRTASSGAISK